jgi:hypothetical protein
MYFGFFQIPTTMNFYEEIWHESLLLCTRCLLHCSSLLLQWSIWFEFFQVSWCLDLGVNHFPTFLIQSWRLSICANSILEEVDSKCGGSFTFSNHKEKGVFVFVLRPTSGNTYRHMYKYELHNMILDKHTQLLHVYYCCCTHQTWVQFCNTSRQVGAGREVCDIWHQSATTALGCSLLHGKHEYHQ